MSWLVSPHAKISLRVTSALLRSSSISFSKSVNFSPDLARLLKWAIIALCTAASSRTAVPIFVLTETLRSPAQTIPDVAECTSSCKTISGFSPLYAPLDSWFSRIVTFDFLPGPANS